MASPGKRIYESTVEKTDDVVALLRNTKEANKAFTRHLELLKKDGLLPQQSEIQANLTTSNREIGSVSENVEEVEDNYEGQEQGNSLCGSVIRNATNVNLIKPASCLRSSKASGSGLNLSQSNPPLNAGSDPKSKQKPLQKNDEEKTQFNKKQYKLRVSDIMKGENAKFIYEVEHEILVEVLKRPPLYNYRVELKYKSPDYVRSLYLEIANLISKEMGVNVDSFCVENTWKHYYDLYNEYSNKASKSSRSGSSAVNSPPLAKHYEVLCQIDDVHQKRNQTSSTSSEPYKLQPPQKKRKENADADVDEITPFLHTATSFLNNFNQTSTVAVTACQPPPSLGEMIENDPDQSYLLTVLSDFRKLRNVDKRQLKEEILIKVNRYLNSYDNEN